MPAIITIFSTAALLTTGGPFNLEARVPIGLHAAKKQFIAVEHDDSEASSKILVRGYKAKRGKRVRLKVPAIVVDRTDDETAAKTQDSAEKAREKINAFLDKHAVTTAPTLAGGLTGRFRLLEQGLVIAQKEDALIIRSGDASVMKSNTLIKSLSKTVGRCRGTASGKVTHISLMEEWNALAAYVEATCTAEKGAKPTRRVTRLYVFDFAKATKMK